MLWMYGTQKHLLKDSNLKKIRNFQNCMFIFNYNCSKFGIEWNSKNSKNFLWYPSKPKIIYKTLCNTFEEGGLKNVEIKTKIISLQSSWIK